MAISENVQKVAEDIKKELLVPPGGKSQLAQNVQEKAIKAIFGGPVEWVEYMQQFSTNADELARLIPTDGTSDNKRKLARAYLLANGMCGETTTGALQNNVTVDLD